MFKVSAIIVSSDTIWSFSVTAILDKTFAGFLTFKQNFTSPHSEMELDYYHWKLNIRVVSPVARRLEI